MKEHHSFAYRFYVSEAWKRCRASYLRKEPLCERCERPATQVHHKIRLTVDNISDPSISLSFDNLEALCTECHQQEHHPVRWRCDEFGHVEL
jgi:5-methylcytosine-specific restriction endonuclease McrA